MENPLQGYWAGSGLQKGDTVLLHSSMKRVFRFLISKKVEPSAKLIVDSILEEVGIEGTIIFPLFNFDFPIARDTLFIPFMQLGRNQNTLRASITKVGMEQILHLANCWNLMEKLPQLTWMIKIA